jgi:hypothetical protein
MTSLAEIGAAQDLNDAMSIFESNKEAMNQIF